MALIEFEEYRQKLHDLKPAIEELGQAYNLEHAADEVEELENRASEASGTTRKNLRKSCSAPRRSRTRLKAIITCAASRKIC